MGFRRYEEYRDSGVDWLGEVPKHWALPPLYTRYEQVLGKMLDQNKMTGDHPMPYIRNVDVQWDQVNSDDLPVMDIEPNERERFTICNGDLLVCEGGEVGRTAIWNGDDGSIAFQKAIHRLRPLNETESSRFFFYTMCFATGMNVFLVNSNPNTIPHLTGEQLRPYRFPKPPRTEQTAIAAFLDAETSKIDALVAEQRRLIALLKEKRQAVISHAVTKGLNPDAPMKPSGIEWLGDVPEHWSHGIKLKSLAINRPASFTNGPFGSDLLTSELHDEGTPVIYIRDLNVTGYRRRSSSHVTPEKAAELDKFRVDPGDVLIAKVGDPPGFCCTYPAGEPPAIICQDVIRLKPKPELFSSYYLCFLLNSEPGIESINSVCVELTRKRFSLADLQSLRFSIPPRTEQDEIVAHLDRELGKLSDLSLHAEHAIELLQERRTALISAAVTGKIDVRDFTPEETAC